MAKFYDAVPKLWASIHLAGGFAMSPIGTATKADVKGQTQQILDKIDKFLKEAGTDKSKILSANIWLTDIGTWGQMNEVWDAWVAPGNTPARATVEAKLANPALKVEIMIQAAK